MANKLPGREIKAYYKYTKFHYEDGQNDFLRNFHLRISLPRTLNDPFEGLLNNSLEQKMLERITPEVQGLTFLRPHMPVDKIQEIIVNNYNISKNTVGIISLCESPKNLLMWAHYANEHNGICIGFEKNFLVKNIITKDSATSLTPIKVKYDKSRPSETIFTDDAMYDLNSQIINHLVTKSVEWKHEQEHRCIISPKQADRLKILGDINKNKGLYDLIKANQLKEINGNIFYGDGVESIAANFSENKNIAFLKKIVPSSIKSIHFGCRFPKEHKDIIINEIDENKDLLNHISIYQCMASKSKFKLDIERIR